MDESVEFRSDAIQRIKDVIYDLQIGPTEIVPSRERSPTFAVKFDDSAGIPAEVFIPISLTYREIFEALKFAYEKSPRG